MLVIKFLLLLFSVLLGYFLGYLLTERYVISNHKAFDFKGFRCRKCLSFHIAWVTSTIISLIFQDWIMLGLGLWFAVFLFIGLLIDEKEKTISMDEWDEYKNIKE